MMMPDSIELFAANPRYFVTPNPAGFDGLDKRRMRMYPAMSETTALNLPRQLGAAPMLGSPNSPAALAQLHRAQADPKDWLK